MTVSVYIAASLDGYIADRDCGLDWLFESPNPEGSDFGFAEFIAGIDALVMGRRTFEKVLSFGEWPYEKPVFVMSRTLEAVPGHLGGKAEIIGGDVRSVAAALNGRGYRRLYVDGGRVIRAFLREDLVDEMIITRVPILLGGGVPLFGELAGPLRFNHLETTRLNEALVKSRYRRTRE